MKKRAIIKFTILFTGLIFGVWCCNYTMDRSKSDHLHTEKLYNGIYKEKFKTFNGGVLMTSDYSYYLTDSISFREFIGTCDEKELYRCLVKGDSIKAIKYSRRIKYGKEIPIDSIEYSISQLKREGKFE